MPFFKRISQFFSRFKPTFGSMSLAGWNSPAADDVLEAGEEIVAGLGLAAVACWASEFLPYWANMIALGLGAFGVASLDKDFFPYACRTLFAVFALFMAFAQPWVGLVECVALAAWVWYECYERLCNRWVTTLAPPATLVGSLAVWQLGARFVLPFLHPLTSMLYNAGPLIAVGIGVAVSLYCAWRTRRDEDGGKLYHKLAPGACTVLFALFFPMKNSWTGLGAEWLFALVMLGLAFRGPRLLVIVGSSFGSIFAAAFLLMNGSSFLHQVAMAESMSVRDVHRLPVTRNNRIMPIVVGGDFCVQGNDATLTETGTPHAQIIDGTFYWQCAMSYKGFQLNHLFSWIPGSTAGFVLVNAGTTASDTVVNNHGFIFGETSSLVKAAFQTRHANGTITGYTYAADTNGNYRLLVSYTTNQLFWGAMLPVPGVMAVSPWGFVDDYTIAQAARTFPGTFLYPAELARQYADAWAGYTIGKVLTRNYLEVSEAPQAKGALTPLSNPFPYGIDTEAGRKYFIPYEPQGKNGTAMSDIAFFDGASGDADVEILHLADSNEASEKTNLGHRSIQGPRELLEKSANVVQGHFQLTSIEPIIVVTKAGRIYFITANMGPDKSKSNHDYQGDTLSFATGEPQWVITSEAEAQRLIDANEAKLDAAQPKTPVTAPPVSIPTPEKQPAKQPVAPIDASQPNKP